MALWHSVAPRTTKSGGKFQSVRRFGAQRHVAHRHGQFTYQLVQSRTGTTLSRSLFHVAIFNDKGRRVAYLTNFASAAQAGTAARAWIDDAC